MGFRRYNEKRSYYSMRELKFSNICKYVPRSIRIYDITIPSFSSESDVYNHGFFERRDRSKYLGYYDHFSRNLDYDISLSNFSGNYSKAVDGLSKLFGN